MAWALWVLGYPDQAVERIHEALPMAQVLSHPFTLAATLMIAAIVNQFCRDVDTVQAQATAAIAFSTEHGFPYWSSVGEILQGWVQAEQGQGKEGMAQMYQGMAAWRAMGAEFLQPYFVALLAEAYKKAEQAEAGLTLLAQALAVLHKNGERMWEAELYRLKGELLLLQVAGRGGPRPAPTEEVETCFRQALDVARHQQAKSWELRAAMSLSRLWQQQGKRAKARELLAPIYGWFTEGFDTADLQEAKALLAELS